MGDFFLGPFIAWAPVVFYGASFVLIAWIYFLKSGLFSRLGISLFIGLVIFFRVAYAAVLSIAQYYVWSREGLTKLLLPPHQPISYFFGYAFVHFWMEQLLAIAGALVFYIILSLARKYKERWLSREEIALGFLIALLVGWPNVVIFIPLVFLLSALASAVHLIVLKNRYSTLSSSFILAGLFAFIWGNIIIELLHLTVLRV